MIITNVEIEQGGILNDPRGYFRGVALDLEEVEILRDCARSHRRVKLTGTGIGVIPINIKKVIFNDPATIVLWDDGTKTIVKCQDGEKYDKEKGLALCISKKVLGNKGNYNEVFKKYIQYERKNIIKPAAKKANQNAAQPVLQKLTP